jgi:ribosomal-protein-alanine N-acetyltransferase
MSAILRPEPGEPWSVDPMLAENIDAVEAVERTVYEFPWTAGNFRDSLNSGYQGVLLRVRDAMAGYAIQMYAIDEAHLLNITIVPEFQRLGHGSRLLQWLMDEARSRRMTSMFLEVRPSNAKAHSMYTRFGFGQVGIRRDYYPARNGRENALVLTTRL